MSATTFGLMLVLICALIEGIAQIFLKKSVLSHDRRIAWVAAGVTLFALQAVIYTGALWFLELSVAFPVSSLSFVAVVVLSQWLLQETVSKMRWLGVGLILLGTSLVAAHA
jgi:undecaprenyl phosphate-alpha-L-ara4N flippase subunit ArnE